VLSPGGSYELSKAPASLDRSFIDGFFILWNLCRLKTSVGSGGSSAELLLGLALSLLAE
jgi:hypothetical protein